MLISKKKGPKRAGKSIPVKVDHYEERDGELGVVGTNLVNGETVFVTLTNKGEMASHKRRPTLEKFRDHKLIPRQDVGVDRGGVILILQRNRAKENASLFITHSVNKTG